MKTLLAFAAAAALLSSVNVASAASSGRFCVQDRDVQEGQPSKCFKTMAACRKEAIGTGTCVRGPGRSTTGSGMKSNMKMNDSDMDASSKPTGRMQQRKKSGVNN